MSPHPSMLFKRDFTPSCPSGGDFYACEDGSKFVGCCARAPCENGCSQGNIRPVGFNAPEYGTFPDASCGQASDFFSCASGDRTFWGCCKTNPCANNQTCPESDLVPAFMERPEQFNAYVTDGASSQGNDGGDGDSISGGAIAGAVVGGVLGLALIAAVVFFLLRRRKNAKTQHGANMDSSLPADTSAGGQNPPQGVAQAAPPVTEKWNGMQQVGSPNMDAPPVYTSPNPNAYPPTPAAYNPHQPQQQQWAYNQQSSFASELPAETGPSNDKSNRYSELPVDAPRTSELESPVTSPKPTQEGFEPSSPPRKGTGLGF